MSNRLDAIARGTEGTSLVNFTRLNGLDPALSDDWTRIRGLVSGGRLDDLHGPVIMVNQGQINEEYLIHLRGPKANCVVNLAQVLALATAFCAERQQRAATLLPLTLPKKPTRKTRLRRASR